MEEEKRLEAEAAKEDEEENGKKKRKDHRMLRGFVMGILTSALIFMIFFALPVSPTAGSPNSLFTYKKIVEIKKLIDEHYMGEEDDQTLTDYLFLGLIAGLQDPYSVYFTKEEYDAVSTTQNGYYDGIGVTLANRSEDGALFVMDVTEDGPADRAGIRPEDIITAINGGDASQMTSAQAAEIVQTAEGDITLTLYRESTEETLTVTLAKENLESESVTGEVLEGDIGYIKIASFTGVTAAQFHDLYTDMREQEIKGLVVDLRDDPGGLVTAVCDTMREILPEGVMVYTVDKYGNRQDKTCDGANAIDIPLAVLVNENTASAAEIFSGAVQDDGVGTIVGTQTFGKGIVQDVFRLSDGSVIRLTVSHYYTPDGHDIHGEGITPDIYVEDDTETEADEQLKAALAALAE